MGDKAKEKAIRDFIGSIEKGDVDGALTFFDENGEWTANEGVFKGRGEIKPYLTWMMSALKNIKFKDDGIGIITEGEKAVFQHIYEGDYAGKKVKVKGICTYQFSGGKCTHHSTVSDRLSTAEQAAGAFAGLAVDAILKQMEKGL